MSKKKFPPPASGKVTNTMTVLVENRRLRWAYEVLDTFRAGIILSGSETKALRTRGADLTRGYVTIDRYGEVYLRGVNISRYRFATDDKYDPLRVRKLLLRRREIDKIVSLIRTRGITLVPSSIFVMGKRLKCELALVRGKKLYEKKEKKKARDIEREIRKEGW